MKAEKHIQCTKANFSYPEKEKGDQNTVLTTSKTKPKGVSCDVGHQIVIKNSVDMELHSDSSFTNSYKLPPPTAENIIRPFSRFAAITQKKWDSYIAAVIAVVHLGVQVLSRSASQAQYMVQIEEKKLTVSWFSGIKSEGNRFIQNCELWASE